MKKIAVMFIAVFFLSGLSTGFAAEAKNTGPSGASARPAPANNTIFNSLSGFFSTFDRPFTRAGNKEGFWNATANWMRNINKE